MTFYNKKKCNRHSIRLKGRDYSKPDFYFITICCQDRIARFGEITHGKMILNPFGIIAYNEWKKLPQRYINVELDVFQIMPDHIHAIVSLTNVGATLAVARDEATVARDEATVARDEATVARDETMIINNEIMIVLDEPLVTCNNQCVDTDEIILHDLTRQLQGTGQPQGLPLQMPHRNSTVGSIIGAYKSIVSNEILKIYKSQNETMGKLWQRNYYEHIIRNHESYLNICDYIIDNPKRWNEKP